MAGFIGAGLAGAAYLPQISPLIRAHCSAGISRLAFGVWLAASLLVTTHAAAIRAPVFVAFGVIQLAATAVVLIYSTKYEHSYCTIHLPRSLASEPAPGPASRLARAGRRGDAPFRMGTGVRDQRLRPPQTAASSRDSGP